MQGIPVEPMAGHYTVQAFRRARQKSRPKSCIQRRRTHTVGASCDAGLCRCVCRVLFPEIERVLRKEIFNGKVGQIGSNEMVKQLVEGDGASLESFIVGGLYELTLFDRLTRTLAKGIDGEVASTAFVLYQSVDQDSLERVKADPVPNRHAAMHGLVVYSSQLNSLNSIFMTEYVFAVVNSIKASGRGSDSQLPCTQRKQ